MGRGQNFDHMPSEHDKQRVIYADPHINSRGFLMNERMDLPDPAKNEPFMSRMSPPRSPNTFRDSMS